MRRAGGELYNSILYATLGPKPEIINIHRKFFLPTYGVFDEQRFVSRGRTFSAFDTRLARSGMLICEDLWHSVSATLLALKGALIVYVGAASPARGFRGEEIDNVAHWKRLLTSAADEHNIFIAFTSLVGFEGGKGLVGNSCLVGPTGEILNQAPTGKEALLRRLAVAAPPPPRGCQMGVGNSNRDAAGAVGSITRSAGNSPRDAARGRSGFCA